MPVFLVTLSKIWPSPENDELYLPIDKSDPRIIELSKDIRENGIIQPLDLTLDHYIISGHRRFAAAQLAGLRKVPARFDDFRRSDDLDRFLRLLRGANLQREKTRAERLREEVAAGSPERAYESLIEHRETSARVRPPAFEIVGEKRRSPISRGKKPMMDAIMRVLAERVEYWPLSDRQIHYALLTDPPPIHTASPDRKYANTRQCYNGLCDLLTRARLTLSIAWECIADETRPVSTWCVHRETGGYVRSQIDSFLNGYSRDVLQSQPNHIELLVEKNTVAGILRNVAAKYRLPMTSGRGYCSAPPRHAMAERYRASGKKKLVLLMVSDFDPDGESIAHSFVRSMRDDFRVTDIHPIKIGLTECQVKAFNLPPVMKAKGGASTYDKFVERFGDDVFEVEALPPDELQRIVSGAIDSVLDVDAFNAELDAEKQDAAFLQGVRRDAKEYFAALDFESNGR